MHFEKTFAELTDQEIISIHICDRQAGSFTTDYHIISTLTIIHQETRHSKSFDRSKYIIPCLGAFAFLDQVGNAYKQTSINAYPNSNASGIKKALYYFGGFGANDAQTQDLYAFRNAVAHNASLLNHNNNKHHSFSYDFESPSIVTSASVEWDGDLNNLKEENHTIINPNKLVDLLDEVLRSLTDHHNNNTLEMNLSRSEIINRYLLWKPKIRKNGSTKLT